MRPVLPRIIPRAREFSGGNGPKAARRHLCCIETRGHLAIASSTSPFIAPRLSMGGFIHPPGEVRRIRGAIRRTWGRHIASPGQFLGERICHCSRRHTGAPQISGPWATLDIGRDAKLEERRALRRFFRVWFNLIHKRNREADSMRLNLIIDQIRPRANSCLEAADCADSHTR